MASDADRHDPIPIPEKLHELAPSEEEWAAALRLADLVLREMERSALAELEVEDEGEEAN